MEGITNIFHLKAPGNWINDPNGFIYYGGKYHLFYQHFPYAPFWATMHWGHAVSDDLVHWEHLGIALMPTKDYDRNGIFSGSALEKDGKLYLYYTGVSYCKEKPDNIHLPEGPMIQSQAFITSLDGYSFDNFHDKKQIISAIEDTNIGDPNDCRDPKVWKVDDTYYMCLGSTHLGEKGVLILYKSEDAVNWEYLSRLESDAFGTVLECPDLFNVDGKWLLICSPCGNNVDGEGYDNQAIIQPVEFIPKEGMVSLNDEAQFLDYGFDLYAPQSNLDEEGNRVVMSWVRMECPMVPKDNPASGGKLWNGMMAIPRVLEVRDGEIYTIPHNNIRRYFLSDKCKCEDNGHIVKRSDGLYSQIIMTITEGEWINLNGYKIGLVDGQVVGDRTELVPQDVNVHKVSRTPYVGSKVNLEIYCDPDLIEIFVADGKYVLTHATYRNTAK